MIKNNKIYQGNSFELIDKIQDNTIKLTITSPPYNIGKIYEQKTSIEKYLEPFKEFAENLFLKTNENGHVCWQVGNYVKGSEIFPLDIFFYNIFKSAGFKLRNRIIWHFEHGLHSSKRFSGRYETLMWFSKTDNYTFNLNDVRVPAKYPGKLYYKGKDKGKPSGNPLGKNPSDVWKIVKQDWEKGIWDIPNVKANHPEKTIHPCQLPVELIQRCILALTNEKDLVFDPFLGVGSTSIAACSLNRNYVGFELLKKYIDISRRRINSLKKGKLKVRPLGKVVYQPTGNEKVSQVPKDWLKLVS